MNVNIPKSMKKSLARRTLALTCCHDSDNLPLQ